MAAVRDRIRYDLRDMREWNGVAADLVITDPPFGLEFDGKAGNYNRETARVVDGYIEWATEEYADQIVELLGVAERNTGETGQLLLFSGKDNAHLIHRAILDHDGWRLEGKLYWAYNFAPFCKNRPAHNVYELFWAVKGDEWYYTNECPFDHCQRGEANLSLLSAKREYLKEMPKYPTRLPLGVVNILLEHFTREGHVIFDPLAGAGSVGIAAALRGREAVLGDRNPEAKAIFEETITTLAEGEELATTDHS